MLAKFAYLVEEVAPFLSGFRWCGSVHSVVVSAMFPRTEVGDNIWLVLLFFFFFLIGIAMFVNLFQKGLQFKEIRVL